MRLPIRQRVTFIGRVPTPPLKDTPPQPTIAVQTPFDPGAGLATWFSGSAAGVTPRKAVLAEQAFPSFDSGSVTWFRSPAGAVVTIPPRLIAVESPPIEGGSATWSHSPVLSFVPMRLPPVVVAVQSEIDPTVFVAVGRYSSGAAPVIAPGLLWIEAARGMIWTEPPRSLTWVYNVRSNPN